MLAHIFEHLVEALHVGICGNVENLGFQFLQTAGQAGTSPFLYKLEARSSPGPPDGITNRPDVELVRRGPPSRRGRVPFPSRRELRSMSFARLENHHVGYQAAKNQGDLDRIQIYLRGVEIGRE